MEFMSIIAGLFLFLPMSVAGSKHPSSSFDPTEQHFTPGHAASCQESSGRESEHLAEGGAPHLAMLQKSRTVKAHQLQNPPWSNAWRNAAAWNNSLLGTTSPRQAESLFFRWGVNHTKEHPRSIGKSEPHPNVQYYEARVQRLQAMVLNIFPNASNGHGGLLIALEVPSPCSAGEAWAEVDRARCSGKYPCSLRLPGGAVRGSEGEPTKFRTKVITKDEDYGTDYLEYEHVTLDPEAEVTLAHKMFDSDGNRRVLKFNLDAVLAAGALSITPVVTGASAETRVTMRLRQPDPAVNDFEAGPPREMNLVESDGMKTLETQLRSYRAPWANQWRPPSKTIAGCDFSLFEVVADQLYPGEVEVEVWIAGGRGTISDVLITNRISWAEAEVKLLDSILKDHFAFFNDPDVIIHGLPVGALKKDDPGQYTGSNPTEWGYAMQSWVVMAETGVLKPEETVAKLTDTFKTLEILQHDPDQFAHGMFYPYYSLRDKTGKKVFPNRTDYLELPCGDDALLYASLMMIQGWLITNQFKSHANTCARIVGRMDFTKCLHTTKCNADASASSGDEFWSVPLTFNAITLEKSSHNWNVWADEGGLVAMIVALTGAANSSHYESIVRQQQRYSPCAHWQGITVGHAAFFNSVFTLPTRSMLGFGTLFASAYYHEFAVRSVLPSFRGYQKLKKMLKLDYMGASDAMTQSPKGQPDKIFGSYAYWPPNNMYNCYDGKVLFENQCTWCGGVEYEGLEGPLDLIVPHGNMAAFLVSAMMERSMFSEWLEDTKMLMTDASGVYKPRYGLEVIAPAKRTKHDGVFDGADGGRGIWESLSQGYTILSMYEGLATMRRRYDLAKQAGATVPGSYEPPNYTPLSDFTNAVPKLRHKIDKLLAVAKDQESEEKQCVPSEYGAAFHR